MASEQPSARRLRIEGVRRHFDESEEVVRERAAARLRVDAEAIQDLVLLKRSLDARGKPRFTYHVEVALEPARALKRLPKGVTVAPPPGALKARRFRPQRRDERVVVIGAGPSGLFCAHRLAESGLKPILLDRGQPVEVRGRHVSRLMHHGELDPESNICFGEGGAGTWSDGKLYTRVKDARVRHIMEQIVELGGPERILVDAKPHLGTDRLVALCKAFRRVLTELGCQVRFGALVEDLIVARRGGQERVVGVKLKGGERIEADRVVLAVGHSAREMYDLLAERGTAMERKPFAMGFRVEHPQRLINQIQYGRWAESDLPTADYRLAENFNEPSGHRGVYSFCMCPGGQVVPSATRPGHVCVNGMSHASRRGHWANSALVVSIRPEEFDGFGDEKLARAHGGLLAGVAMQEEAERRAYELGQGGFLAPAQTLPDFKAGVASAEIRKTTYKPGVTPASLESCYPPFMIAALRRALPGFERRMKGFVSQEAVLIGVETRTSAPVRVLRDEASLESISLKGLYPCGEGAGYGGGIVSAALDGLRIAERILEELEASTSLRS